MQEPELFTGDSDHAIFAVHNVLVMVWHGDITPASLEGCRAAGRAMDRRFPKGIGSCIVAREGIPLPRAAARRLSEETMREASRWVRAAAIVIEGEGFWTSTARSIYTAMLHFTRVTYDQRVFKHVVPASSFLAETLEDAPSGAALREAIAAARSKLAPTGASR